jgi:5-methylthioadenosine/S-adenosylhomocysteine deaminase
MQAGPANVDTVMIAGEIKKRNGKLLTAGVAQKQAKLVDSGQRIVSEFAAL